MAEPKERVTDAPARPQRRTRQEVATTGGPSEVSPYEERPERDVATEGDLPMLRIAYEEGKRLLDDQESELDGMRVRAVQFLAFTGSATAFLVGAGLTSAFRDGGFTFWAVVGAIVFMLVLATIASLLLGADLLHRRRLEWTFRMQPAKLASYLKYDIGRPDEPRYLDALVQRYQEYADENDLNLKTVRAYYFSFLALASGSLALWIGLVCFYR